MKHRLVMLAYYTISKRLVVCMTPNYSFGKNQKWLWIIPKGSFQPEWMGQSNSKCCSVWVNAKQFKTINIFCILLKTNGECSCKTSISIQYWDHVAIICLLWILSLLFTVVLYFILFSHHYLWSELNHVHRNSSTSTVCVRQVFAVSNKTSLLL